MVRKCDRVLEAGPVEPITSEGKGDHPNVQKTCRTVAAFHRAPSCAVGTPLSFRLSAIFGSEGDVGPRRVELDRRLWSAMSVRKVAVVASASGNGKTTLGRELAQRLRVPFIELDSLVHGPGWVEISDEDLRARVEPIVISDGWVIDGAYQHKLGDLVLNSADLVVWLDLPIRTWLPRLIRRTGRRLRTREQLWNGNTESLASAMWGRESLLAWALRSHFRRRREWPDAFATRPVVRLTTPSEVDRFLAEARSLSPPN